MPKLIDISQTADACARAHLQVALGFSDTGTCPRSAHRISGVEDRSQILCTGNRGTHLHRRIFGTHSGEHCTGAWERDKHGRWKGHVAWLAREQVARRGVDVRMLAEDLERVDGEDYRRVPKHIADDSVF